MLKRSLDLLLASLGLLLLTPVLMAVAIAIKLDSPGPIFFRQTRVGRYGHPFRIFKFRTMHHAPQAAQTPELTIAGDARITRLGQHLRATKIDELPQLIDVLRGTMSLVGPRPEVPHYVAHYPEPTRTQILSVRPGITDLASLHYRDENERLAQSPDPEQHYLQVILPAKLQYAQNYVHTQSLRQDLRIMLLTLQQLITLK